MHFLTCLDYISSQIITVCCCKVFTLHQHSQNGMPIQYLQSDWHADYEWEWFNEFGLIHFGDSIIILVLRVFCLISMNFLLKKQKSFSCVLYVHQYSLRPKGFQSQICSQQCSRSQWIQMDDIKLNTVYSQLSICWVSGLFHICATFFNMHTTLQNS
jgi:hypothetical protein